MKNLFDVSGKVVLVTGGSRGIGEMIATGFAANGAKVYISSRDAEACDEVATRLSQDGDCIALPNNLAHMEGVEKLAAELKNREGRLDVLINNAGANWGAPIDEFPESGWDKVMNLNVKSIFFLTQKLLPELRAAGSHENPSRVINVASIDGMHAPGLETYSYSSSKAAVISLTRHLASRLARDNINVTGIAPGPFRSKMMAATLDAFEDALVQSVPRRRIGVPEDMAGIAMFLASQASSYITGATIPVDGGLVAAS